jgi:hypothetical protein
MGLRAETAAGTAVGAFVEMPAGVAPDGALDEAPPGAPGAASRSEGFRLVIANKPRSYQ